MTLLHKNCPPCHANMEPLTVAVEDQLFKNIPTWHIERTPIHHLCKKFTFGSFMEAIGFVNRMALCAERLQHHPIIHINYTTISVDLWTHAIGGLSQIDFILAENIDTCVDGAPREI
ncbi:MAG: 4a-hydroxytetrahydrobiopterin dehydratase [Chitinivibrionales bacterium]|nr:4a-hydroxytetrahydrobiopterin dehydratase [Chitinivibrionales bacterium]